MPQWGEERDQGRGVEGKGEEPRKEGDKQEKKSWIGGARDKGEGAREQEKGAGRASPE